ncbi:hypothetical protein PSACC_03707 [Paramicrosporidium saccamoebae]|uniref:Uncharacterized protein n=1 Tax=Paramicrosporidium saccamoebae TaxID=1246581 RepID=A0A2H9TFI0_9FUNG|nr:hypothetical protein PSACC_03707 [Paramicrosporidium saccamoebae]
MKTAIVTGASRGIGAAVCRNLRTKGIRVIGVARSEDALRKLCMEKIGSGPMEYVVGDITDPKTVETAVALATKDGNLEMLILNAAILTPMSKIDVTKIEEFQRAYDVNVFCNLVWIQAALPALRAATKGTIVYVTSGASDIGVGGLAAYGSSKAAMNSVMRVLAEEEPEVISLTVNPGPTGTKMWNEFLDLAPTTMDAAQMSQYAKMGKDDVNKPEDVAESFVRLALSAPKTKSGSIIAWDESWIQSL